MRIAFFTPLNPVRSGISDYSEELLPFLGKLADIDIVIDNYEPSEEAIRARFPVIGVDQFSRRRPAYDCVIYQIGNNYPAHGYMLPCLASTPGIVVLHDYSLTYLMLPVTAQRGDQRSLRDILAPGCGARSGSVARRLLLGLADPYDVSLARPVIEMSRAVIVHNHHSLEKLVAEFPEKLFRHIPHATPIREPRGDLPALRSSYGFSPDDLILASVSSLAYNKHIQAVLTALHALRGRFPALKFVMVGQGELGAAARKLIQRLGLDGYVKQTGWVSSQQYLDYIDLADIVIDLRYPTAGETSGSSLRAMQAAKPLVVSAEGFFLELPDDCCIRVNPGSAPDELCRALADLLADPGKRARLGQRGREFTLRHLRLEQAAESYFEFAREVASSGASPSRKWIFRASPDKALRGRMVSSAYRAGRLAYYLRRYGLSGTLNRVRSQLSSTGS